MTDFGEAGVAGGVHHNKFESNLLVFLISFFLQNIVDISGQLKELRLDLSYCWELSEQLSNTLRNFAELNRFRVVRTHSPLYK